MRMTATALQLALLATRQVRMQKMAKICGSWFCCAPGYVTGLALILHCKQNLTAMMLESWNRSNCNANFMTRLFASPIAHVVFVSATCRKSRTCRGYVQQAVSRVHRSPSPASCLAAVQAHQAPPRQHAACWAQSSSSAALPAARWLPQCYCSSGQARLVSICRSVHQRQMALAVALQAALQLQHSTAVMASTATVLVCKGFSRRKRH
jgi:hypothetical protein